MKSLLFHCLHFVFMKLYSSIPTYQGLHEDDLRSPSTKLTCIYCTFLRDNLNLFPMLDFSIIKFTLCLQINISIIIILFNFIYQKYLPYNSITQYKKIPNTTPFCKTTHSCNQKLFCRQKSLQTCYFSFKVIQIQKLDIIL